MGQGQSKEELKQALTTTTQELAAQSEEAKRQREELRRLQKELEVRPEEYRLTLDQLRGDIEEAQQELRRETVKKQELAQEVQGLKDQCERIRARLGEDVKRNTEVKHGTEISQDKYLQELADQSDTFEELVQTALSTLRPMITTTDSYTYTCELCDKEWGHVYDINHIYNHFQKACKYVRKLWRNKTYATVDYRKLYLEQQASTLVAQDQATQEAQAHIGATRAPPGAPLLDKQEEGAVEEEEGKSE